MAEETRPRAHRQTSAHTDRFAHKNVHTQRKCTHKRIGHESEENKFSGIVSFWKSFRTIKLVRKSCLDVNYTACRFGLKPPAAYSTPRYLKQLQRDMLTT